MNGNHFDIQDNCDLDFDPKIDRGHLLVMTNYLVQGSNYLNGDWDKGP